MSCYASCLSSVSTLDTGSIGVCPSDQDNAICGFISATNIMSVSAYSMWSCNPSGVVSTDPCGGTWMGIACDGKGQIISLELGNQAITGMIE